VNDHSMPLTAEKTCDPASHPTLATDNQRAESVPLVHGVSLHRLLFDGLADEKGREITSKVLVETQQVDCHHSAKTAVVEGHVLDHDAPPALDRSNAFQFLVDQGYVGSLVEASVRFALSNESISTSLIGIANIAQLQQAIEYGNKGPLPTEAIDKLGDVWAGFAE